MPRRALILACAVVSTSVARAEPAEDELVGVITAQPRAAHAEAYVNLFLDRLNREDRRAELVAWVDRMLAMPQLLRGRDELVGRLEAIRIRARFFRAMELQRLAHRSDQPGDWRSAARMYLEAAAFARGTIRVRVEVNNGLVTATVVDEATFNAGICLAAAGDLYAAVGAFDAVTGSSLAPFAYARMLPIVVRAPVTALARGAAWLAE